MRRGSTYRKGERRKSLVETAIRLAPSPRPSPPIHAFRGIDAARRGEGDGAMRLQDRSGYTLLELLIASALIATLMAAAWGLMSMYSSFLVAGRSQAEEQQLSRSLMDLVASDLRATGPLQSRPADFGRRPTPPARHPGETGSALLADNAPAAMERRAGEATVEMTAFGQAPVSSFGEDQVAGVEPLPEIAFSGDEHSLTLIGVRHEPRFDAASFENGGGDLMMESLEFETDIAPADSGDGLAPEIAAAPEWTQIVYQFVAPQAASGEEGELAPGLHRFEIPVEFLGLLVQSNEAGVEPFAGEGELSTSSPEELSAEFLDSIRLLIDQRAPGVSHEHIPEVVACRFEYYSGSGWQLNWALSPEFGRPLAVRVSVRLLSSEETRDLGALLGLGEVDDVPADVEGADPFEAFHPRLYQRTILTDLDREAVKPFDPTATDAMDSVASTRFRPGGE